MATKKATKSKKKVAKTAPKAVKSTKTRAKAKKAASAKNKVAARKTAFKTAEKKSLKKSAKKSAKKAAKKTATAKKTSQKAAAKTGTAAGETRAKTMAKTSPAQNTAKAANTNTGKQSAPARKPKAAGLKKPDTGDIRNWIRMEDLKNSMCRWPSGDPRDKRKFHFCGDKTIAGRPYCEKHDAMSRRSYDLLLREREEKEQTQKDQNVA